MIQAIEDQEMEEPYESDESIHVPEQQIVIPIEQPREASLNEMIFEEAR